MPRDLPTGLISLLKSGFAETHSTLVISLLGPGRAVKQTIYLATAAEGEVSGSTVSPPTTPPITVPNGGFETPALGPPGYQYAPAGASWTFTACGMIQGSLFGSIAVPEGVQGAFLQQTGSFQQAISGFVGGVNYQLRLKAVQQLSGQVTHDFDVYLDSTLLGHVTPPVMEAGFGLITLPFTTTAGTHTLKFQGVNTAGGTVSSIVDDVQIVPVSSGGGSGAPPRPGIQYLPRLRQTGPVAMSLTRSADRCDVIVENIDRIAGSQFVAVQDELYGSFAEFGRLWRDLRNPANTYQVTLLTGQIVAARASETEVQLTLMSDIYSSGAIAGQILYSRSCPWTFKDPATCAFVGPESTCNKLLDDPGGCSGRSNEHHFGGFPYIKSVDTISDAAGIQSNLQYQTIIQPASLTREELEAGARATTAIIQRHNLLLQGFTITDSPADDATKIVAGGVGGANYQTLKENDGYSYVRVLPPQPTLNFLNSFKLRDDPGNLETDITTYGVPTGTLNLRTDFDASGSIDVANVVSFNISGIVTVDAVLNLQPRMGILVEGAGVGGADFQGTIGSVSTDGKTYVLTTAFPQAPPSGARVQGDDTVAVQAWITAHGDLAMPPGYYRISNSIVVPTTSEGFSLIVHGSGWDVTVFAFQGPGDGFVPTLPDLKVDSLVFKDLTIATGTKWNASGLINAANHGYGIRMTAPGYLGVYNNFVLERCRLIGWGCFPIWSDNLEVSWINNCIFRENRFGHIALVAPDQIETAKLPNANVLRSNAFDQAYGGGDAHRTASGSMTQPPASPTPAQTDAARSISLGGVSLTAADRGRVVIVHGAGTNNSNLYSFIDVVSTATTAKLAHAAQTTVSGATVEILSSSIASIFLNRAHDTVIDGGTIQGNFTTALPGEECNAIRADECFNLRVVGVHEEDAGGNGGSAIRLANCIAVTIENYGGTSAGPGLTNAHNADFQLINTHGVSVKNCFFNDRPQFVIDDTSSEVQIDDSWIVGYNNLWQADRSWDRLRIGSGVRTAQAAESRTAQTAGNEYSYDGFFGRDLVLNGQFLDGSDGFESWTKATGYISRTANSPYQGGTFINVDATGVADDPSGTPVLVLEQVVSIPDVVGPGLFILGFNWNLDFQNGTEQTGRFMEVRLHPSSGVDEAIQWSTRPFPVVQDTWQVGHVRCFLGTGTGRTIAIRINVTQGPNNVSMHFANFRLAAGKHIFGSWERGISDFGGRMRAPLEFAPITNPPYPPPPPGSPIISIVNVGGVLNIGKNGAYVPVTPGGPGTITGPPDYYAIFNSAGTGLDYGYIKNVSPQTVRVMAPLLIDRTRPIFSTFGDLGAGPQATLVLLDSTNVCYFGPEFNASSTQSGSDVVIRAAHGDLSSLQISGAGRRATFNAPLALPGITSTLPTFFLGIDDLNLDGLRIQPLPHLPTLYLGYMLSCYLSDAAADALFAVNQTGNISRLNNLSYQWPGSHAAGFLQNNGSGSLTWGGAGGHIIQDETVDLPTQPRLNFTGQGVVASNPPGQNRTDVIIQTASTSLEGTVSIGAQHFTGHKWFHRGAHFWDDAGGVQVPLVAQVGSLVAADTGAHIQEWWISGSTPLAYLDTQPVLRLGYPGAGVGRAGYLELCCDATVQTVQLACGISATQSQILYFPKARPTASLQVLQVSSVFGSDVQLQWATVAAAAGPHVISEEGTPLAAQPILNFTGAGVTASNGSGQTLVKVDTATPSFEGTVSISAQTFGGRKLFNNGMQAVDSVGVPVVAQYSGADLAAHIQDWWISGSQAIAYIDAQPILRLGYPGAGVGRTGYLELCCDATVSTVKLACGISATQSQTVYFPPARPANNQFLQVSSVFGADVQLRWATIAAGGNVSVTAPQGTDNRVPRWVGATSPTTALEDSAIEDRTTGGTGTVEMDASTFLLRNAGGGAEVVDFFMRTPGGFSTIWRYDRRTGSFPPNGIADSVNSDEQQLHFGNFNSTPTILGPVHSWFQGGLRVRPTSSNTGTVGNAFEIQDTGGTFIKFAVEQNGNLQYIFGIPYTWPNAAAPVGQTTYLSNNGSGTLSWLGITGGGITGTGTVNYLPRVKTLSGANVATIQDSAISDDGSTVAVIRSGTTRASISSAGDVYGLSFNTPASGVNGINITATAITINSASGAQSIHAVGSLKLQTLPDSIIFVPGHVGASTGVVYVSVNGASNEQIPFGHGNADGDIFKWSAGFNKWTVGTNPAASGAGTGTNTYLSRWTTTSGQLADAGIYDTVAGNAAGGGGPNGTTPPNGIVINRDYLYPRGDGLLNLGDTVTRIGGVFVKNNFWMWAGANAGNSASSPTTMGFLSMGPSTYSRILVSGNENYIQGSPQSGRMTLGAYHAIELRGSRRQGSAGNVSTTAGDGYGVLVWQEINDVVPFRIDSQFTLGSPLAAFYNFGTEKFRVGPQGTIYAKGGTQFGAIELQYPANSTIAISSDWRTVIVDTVNGPQNLTLPSAQANPGMIVDIIHMKAVQQILSPLSLPSTFVPGYDQVVNVRTTGFTGGPDVFNAWPTSQAQATSFKMGYPGTNGLPNPDNQHKMIRFIADQYLAIWWLMPYYL